MSAAQARLFIDHQNFLRRWIAGTSGARLDWLQFPAVLGAAARQALIGKGHMTSTDDLDVVEGRVYMSAFAPDDSHLVDISARTGVPHERLKRVRDSHIKARDTLASILVPPFWHRHVGEVLIDDDPGGLMCMRCDRPVQECQRCGGDDVITLREKGVDEQLAVDLVDIAWRHTIGSLQNPPKPMLDVAIILSSDADMIPAAKSAKGKGVKVVNATWRQKPGRLASSSHAVVWLDELVGQLVLAQTVP